MQKLTEYTDGGFILAIIYVCLSIIAIVATTFALLRRLRKNNIGELETIITVVLMIINSVFTGGVIGYFWAIFTTLC